MSIRHNGFDFACDSPNCENKFTASAFTRRTAITHARRAEWFIGRVRALSGAERPETVERVFCRGHRYLVGAYS